MRGGCVGGLWSVDYHMRGRTTTNKSLFTLGFRIIEPLCHRMLCDLWCHWETRGFRRERISRFGPPQSPLVLPLTIVMSMLMSSGVILGELFQSLRCMPEFCTGWRENLYFKLVSDYVMESWRTISFTDINIYFNNSAIYMQL